MATAVMASAMKAAASHGRPSAAGAAADGSDATDPSNAKKTVPNDPKDLANRPKAAPKNTASKSSNL